MIFIASLYKYACGGYTLRFTNTIVHVCLTNVAMHEVYQFDKGKEKQSKLNTAPVAVCILPHVLRGY